LKRWKRAWFVLYTSGRLSYFDTEHATSAEEHIHIAAERAQLQTASQLVAINPPEHHDQSLLFALTTPHKMWYMCADNQDELMFVIYLISHQPNFRAWTLSLQEASMIQPIRYGQYRGVDPAGMRAVYPEQVRDAKRFGVYDPSLAPNIYQQDGNTVIQLPPGTTLYLSPDGPILIDANGSCSISTYSSSKRFFRSTHAN